ncbi:MAG: hypothetical protein V7L23_03325 [Nostoc sp.]|uniref:hypothetical protein n=1 Tax=Nostoc sp. TaxID=1180 RepID=UPI002FEF20CD
MPHIISSRVTQYQAQAITGVTICRKFINSLIICHGALGIGHWALFISPPTSSSPSSPPTSSSPSSPSSPPTSSSPSSPLPYPFHQYFNSELVNSWLWDF